MNFGSSWNWKQVLAFFIAFFPATLFYALQNQSVERLPLSPLSQSAHWVQQSYDAFTHQLQTDMNTYLQLVDTNLENKSLKLENSQLASNLQLLEEYRSENIRLRKLLNFQQDLTRKTLAARIISKDILVDQKSVLIDKGSEHGIQRLQGVISTKGVVGYVIEVTPSSSRILLLTDRSSSIDALIQRTRARGIISGVSRSLLRLKYIMRKEDVEAKDSVVTSGRQGFFPKGFLVGTINHIDEDSLGVSYYAEVKPAIDINKLEEVLVIVEKKTEKTNEVTLKK